jgi:septal ring factor EnvC (AmiA/AmiB activator)
MNQRRGPYPHATGVGSKRLSVCLVLAVLSLGRHPLVADEVGQKIEQPVEQALEIRRTTQEQEVQWREERQRMEAELENLETEVEQLTAQKQALTDQVEGYQERIVTKERQVADIHQMEQELDPFLAGVYDRLHHLVDQGLPFLEQERHQRVERLAALLKDPSVTRSERYRKLMEALLIEAEYGQTIETWQERIELGQSPLLVQVFRLGRLGLFYLTLDQSGCGFYNEATATWHPLPERNLPALAAAVDIAARRRPAELVTMPLGRMVAK